MSRIKTSFASNDHDPMLPSKEHRLVSRSGAPVAGRARITGMRGTGQVPRPELPPTTLMAGPSPT